jgi:7,8-dihydropterin-6-yl-methyl-4-(beta-D-ribofuranosyl)aminobenzene 5'-phosphate synthase
MIEAPDQSGSITLKSVQRIEVTTLLDNYVDLLLESTEIVKRPPLTTGTELPRETLIAEHGLSLLVTADTVAETHTILYDTGYNSGSLLHNMSLLGTDIQSIEAIVLSHAHMDHTGSLLPILEKIPGPIPLVVHPAAFEFPRTLKLKNGASIAFPRTLDRDQLAAANVILVESNTPRSIAADTITVTGQVERITDFEKGMPNASVQRNGHTEQDAILDDQSLILHLQNRGLVLITGCCHAGIVNTVCYARKVTGIQTVYAILGGFHLSGAFFDPLIDTTVAALREVDPTIIVPMHCTGWRATKKFSEAFPEAFILNSVGSTYVLE